MTKKHYDNETKPPLNSDTSNANEKNDSEIMKSPITMTRNGNVKR